MISCSEELLNPHKIVLLLAKERHKRCSSSSDHLAERFTESISVYKILKLIFNSCHSISMASIE